MKKYLQLFALLAVVFGTASINFAQTVGGFKKVPTDNTGVVAAANFAVETQAEKTEAGIELLTVHKAEQQVVAGMNFKMCLQVNVADGTTDDPFEQYANVVVYRTLKNEFTLKSWSVVESCD